MTERQIVDQELDDYIIEQKTTDCGITITKIDTEKLFPPDSALTKEEAFCKLDSTLHSYNDRIRNELTALYENVSGVVVLKFLFGAHNEICTICLLPRTANVVHDECTNNFYVMNDKIDVINELHRMKRIPLPKEQTRVTLIGNQIIFPSDLFK